ncbi:MAG: DUF1853 family protein [Oceanicoccus sp.]|uniref:DUF1853 family protein n=1 Tax=Oceanicoccus sp. TaxID=2691044 RepID=UPI002635FDDF|nr:DUF1853 family protein [Oceanicoccus sp.]MCP3906557.1 DUF1853 family protein [Oceanicoccus sp.]
MATITSLKNQCVRDLAWSCFGQNLINDFGGLGHSAVQSCHIHLTAARQQWLLQLDQEPTPLLDYLSQPRSPRIGLYFEALWQFFITHDAHLELLAHNLQVSYNKKTYGEFDVIYRDNSNGNSYHLELAIKFYLNNSLSANRGIFSTDFGYWLGPNAIDRLDIKTEHLLNHQIKLSASEAGKNALALLGLETVIPEIAIKGRLFYPHSINPEASTAALSPSHNYGHWANLSNLNKVTQTCVDWLILDRSEWISPVYRTLAELEQKIKCPLQLQDTLSLYFSTNSQPLMICGLEQRDDYYCEKVRFFITADNWPKCTRRTAHKSL